jgi:RHS repeat-associated protein
MRKVACNIGMVYRFGFNGKEKDDEVKGEGNSLNYDARIYDTRIGKWLSTDPLQKKYPSYSPYCAFNGNPILFKDPTGKGAEISNVNLTENTAQMTFYVNVYIDPNSAYNGNIANDISSQLGSRSSDGSWNMNVGQGTIRAGLPNGGTVELKVSTKVVVNVITAEQAKEMIASEQEQSNNYYSCTGVSGHNMDGSNQGILKGNLNQSNFAQVLTHELWHSVANGYNDPTRTDLKFDSENVKSTYGLHNSDPCSVMMPGTCNGLVNSNNKSLLQSDYDAIRPNFDHSKSNRTQKFSPIGVEFNGNPTRGGQAGGEVNNDNKTNCELEERCP